MSAVREPLPSELRWKHVVEIARQGNEPPPRRVEKTDAEWRAQLSAEEYQVARRISPTAPRLRIAEKTTTTPTKWWILPTPTPCALTSVGASLNM